MYALKNKMSNRQDAKDAKKKTNTVCPFLLGGLGVLAVLLSVTSSRHESRAISFIAIRAGSGIGKSVGGLIVRPLKVDWALRNGRWGCSGMEA